MKEELNIENEIKEELIENPIDKQINLKKEFANNSSDKNITEYFLESFMVKVCDILLIVVGQLTYSEQILINKIKEESKRQNKNKIFIIHNLQDFISVEQVESYIKNSLLNCSTFDLKKQSHITTDKDKEENKKEIKINRDIIPNIENNEEINIDNQNMEEDLTLTNVHFTETINFNKTKLEVYHLILANEDSEAGLLYNPYTYTFITNMYNIIAGQKKFDIFEQVKNTFKNMSSTIIVENIGEAKFNETEKILQDKIMKLDHKDPLTLKRFYTNELGFSIFGTGNVEIKYNYFKDEKTLEIRLEVPGKAEIDVNHTIVGEDAIITIKGKKIQDKNPKELNDNITNLREYGDFELNINLKVEEFKINSQKPKEGYPKFVNGICIIQYELAILGEKTSVTADADL